MLVSWRYRPRGSPIQGFDPRAWLIFFACFLGAVWQFWDLRVLAIFFALAMYFIFTSGVSWAESRRAWLFIGGFIVFFSALTFLTGRGGAEVYTQERLLWRLTLPIVLFGWQPNLDITLERSIFALAQFLRVFSIAGMTILIPYSLNPALYGITFRGLGLSDKAAFAMDLTMRFIPSFGRDFQTTLDAQRARGYEIENLKGGPIAQVRKFIPLLVPVTIHAMIASEDIIDAMDLRAFGTGPRTWLDELRFRRQDYALVALSILMLVICVALSLLSFGRFWLPW